MSVMSTESSSWWCFSGIDVRSPLPAFDPGRMRYLCFYPGSSSNGLTEGVLRLSHATDDFPDYDYGFWRRIDEDDVIAIHEAIGKIMPHRQFMEFGARPSMLWCYSQTTYHQYEDFAKRGELDLIPPHIFFHWCETFKEVAHEYYDHPRGLCDGTWGCFD